MSDKPCVKCGSTDRLPPAKDGRSVGRCRECHNKKNRRHRGNNGTSPFECISEGCTRRSRAMKKPGLCNTCYSRKWSGASAKFPADPLIDYVEKAGTGWAGRSAPKRGSKISLEYMDAFCIDVLGIHPWVVYGRLYFQECVS